MVNVAMVLRWRKRGVTYGAARAATLAWAKLGWRGVALAVVFNSTVAMVVTTSSGCCNTYR
jgi:hypothetical protein